MNKVVPADELMDEAIDWARTLVRMAPRTISNFNQMIHQAASMSQPEATAFANALEVNLRGMEDSLEGPTAFAEKREAVFKNR